MPTDISPRFRTAHDAGKYIAAQLYPAARYLTPDEFGAVPNVLPNPAWDLAQFEVVEHEGLGGNSWYEVKDLHAEPTKTSREWYDEYNRKGYIIVMASGWDDIPEGEFDEFFHFKPITRTEFLTRMMNSTLDMYVK